MKKCLIALGLAGLISPRLAALLHNLGTVMVAANSIRRLLLEGDSDITVKPETTIVAWNGN